MKNIRWDNVGYTTLIVLLMVLAIVQANWFALGAVMLSAYFITLSAWYRYNLMRARVLLDKAGEIIHLIVEDMSDDDTKA